MSVRTRHLLILALWLGLGFTLPGQLYLPGDDVLTGKLHALDTSGGRLEWSYPGVTEPFAFAPEAVSHIVLPSSEPSHVEPGHHRLTLTQGDILQGTLRKIDDTSVTFDAGFGQELVIPKDSVQRLDRDWDRSKLLYHGPKNAEEWEVGYRGTNWKFDEGYLVADSYSSTGRSFGSIPDKTRFEMDLSLRGDPTVHLFLGADNPRNGGDHYYYLQLKPNVISCDRYWRDHPRTYISLAKEDWREENQQLFQGKKQLHVAVEMDRISKRLQLFLDGSLYASYSDPAPTAPSGNSVILTSYGGGTLRASALRLYALDQLTPPAPEIEAGKARLTNGDVVSTESLTSTHIDEIAAAQFQLPVTPEAHRVTCFLRGGGRLHGDLRLDTDAFALQHRVLGDCNVALTLVDGVTLPGAASVVEAPTMGWLRLKNGDRLGGTPQAWDEVSGLSWQMASSKSILTFPAYSLAEVYNSSRETDSDAKAMLSLRGGTKFPGTITQITPEQITLATIFSEPMMIPTAVVKRLDFNHTEHLYAKGPGDSMARWTSSGTDANWQINKDGVLSGEGLGGVGQSVPMPDRGQLNLEVSWKGFLDASITLFGKSLSRAVQPHSYRFHYEREKITLYRGLSEDEVKVDQDEDDPLRNRRLDEQLERFSAKFGGGASRKLGSPLSVDLRKHETIRRIAICWDVATAEISLVIDGVVMRTWKDDQGLVPPAAGLLFHQHNQQTHFRVHHFTVEEWNGVLPEPPLTIAETQVLQEAHVRLRNEDQFVAATLTLAAPTAPLMLGSEIGLLPVPIDRLAWVQFPETTFVSTPQEGMIIDVEFQPQGACRCYLSRLENGLLHVSSPYFGKNAFRISSIQSLKFDIGDRAFWALEGLAWPRALPVTMRPAFQR